eukprot:TRINITY_DN2275_c0_g1_i1.p1 TRINITY_DN2275_c0_g1~~TRINITY_DN2275_c0_g1_i1.p1  ORF type:complete len:162 (+),score=43.02 TRINITY_DN2275_c0_g1_i1:39-488(+)
MGGTPATDWGCENVNNELLLVRNSKTKEVYFIESKDEISSDSGSRMNSDSSDDEKVETNDAESSRSINRDEDDNTDSNLKQMRKAALNAASDLDSDDSMEMQSQSSNSRQREQLQKEIIKEKKEVDRKGRALRKKIKKADIRAKRIGEI